MDNRNLISIAKQLFVVILMVGIAGCNENTQKADAYGQFEADQYLISPQVGGKIISVAAGLGDDIKEDELLAVIDSTALHLQKQELSARLARLPVQLAQIRAEEKVVETRLKTAQNEYQRILNMYRDSAATQQKLDQVQGTVQELEAQIARFTPQFTMVEKERAVLMQKLAQIEDQIDKTRIHAPITGRITSEFHRKGEFVPPGKPIMELTSVQETYLKVFVSERQLGQLQVGQEVNVHVDYNDQLKDLSGKIRHIATQAEFTPQNIQTRENRGNLVYAVEIAVENSEGIIKTGMPGDVAF